MSSFKFFFVTSLFVAVVGFALGNDQESTSSFSSSNLTVADSTENGTETDERESEIEDMDAAATGAIDHTLVNMDYVGKFNPNPCLDLGE